MNPVFFEQVAQALATERLDAYRQDGAAPAVALARYVWNMALCEALYSPLQLAEIALRNAQHRALTTRFAIIPDAFDASSGADTPFGHRWGGDVFRLAVEHLAALQAGQTLALDVQNEYIAFLKGADLSACDAQAESANPKHLSADLSAETSVQAEALAKAESIKANLGGLGYGG